MAIAFRNELTPDAAAAVVQAIAAGEYAQSAAGKARITVNTLRKWIQRGENAALQVENGEEIASADEPYIQFFFDLMEAESVAESEAVGEVRDAGRRGNWIASMTFLERRHGNRWKRRDGVEHTGANGGPIKVENLDNSKVAIAELLTVLADAGVLTKGIEGIQIPAQAGPDGSPAAS